MKNISQILRELREDRDICQKELALYLNVSIGTVSNYENGIHFPDPNTLCKLADYFGVTTDYLLGRTEYRYPPEKPLPAISDGYTVGDLLRLLTFLSEDDRAFLAAVLHLLERALPAKHPI